MSDSNGSHLDHAVDDIKRALDTPSSPAASNLADSVPTSFQPASRSSTGAVHLGTSKSRRETHSSSSFSSSSMELSDDSDGLVSLDELSTSATSSRSSKSKTGRSGKSLFEDELPLVSDDGDTTEEGESGEKKAKTLFEPLKEGSKDKDWGKPSFVLLARLLRLARPEFWKILGATIALAVASLGNLALPKLIGGVMDAMANSDSSPASRAANLHLLRMLMVRLAVLFSIIAVASLVRQMLFGIAGEKIVANLRRMLFDKLLTMEIAFYDVNRTGELVNRLSSDTTLIQGTVTTNVSQFLRNLALVIGGLIILFSTSWKLTMLMFVILPILAGISFGYGRFIRALSKKVQDVLAGATTVAEETLGAMRTVKSFGAEGKEGARYAEKVRESYQVAKKRAIVDGIFESVVGLVINICLGSILFFGGWLVVKGDMSAGTLTSFVLYVIQAAAGFVALSALFADFMKAMGASERVFELLDREPTVKFEGGTSPTRFSGNVVFSHVDFTYPSRLDHPVLKDLNLELTPGKTLALVGPSGGGKSTIAHLLLGLYTPSAGTITIDGVPSSELEPSYLREHIAVVAQEPTLFACSIKDNICYGVSSSDIDSAIEAQRHSADLEGGGSARKTNGIYTSLAQNQPNFYFLTPSERQQRVEDAAKMANAHEFIATFPDGYDTMVGERGIRLSGGQKQRIAIARALLKNPRILILDEATSALDSESEHLVKKALDDLLQARQSEGQERAFLVIAHRLSTVKNADMVAVVMNGTIVEKGTHDELLALDGVYKKLVSRQLSQD